MASLVLIKTKHTPLHRVLSKGLHGVYAPGRLYDRTENKLTGQRFFRLHLQWTYCPPVETIGITQICNCSIWEWLGWLQYNYNGNARISACLIPWNTITTSPANSHMSRAKRFILSIWFWFLEPMIANLKKGPSLQLGRKPTTNKRGHQLPPLLLQWIP